jgi:hypothetical protein
MKLAQASAPLLFLVTLAACEEKEKPQGTPPPPPPPTATSPAGANPCAGGGGQIKDEVSKGFFPRTAGGFCIDPNAQEKTYGEKGTLSMDEVCTKAFDGECEVYKSYGLKRVVELRYIDGSGKANWVTVILSTFNDAAGAYGMFTKRVVADGDPSAASVKPLQAGSAAAISSSNAYMWKGQYLAELSVTAEDPKTTKEMLQKITSDVIPAVAKELGDKLPGADLPAVKALPGANLIPLGVVYVPKDVLKITGAAGAVGYYREGDKRFRQVAISKDDADQAKDVLKAIKGKPGALPIKDVGDEAAAFTVEEGKDRPSGQGAEYVFARKGNLVAGVGDDETALAAENDKDKQAKLKLTRDEKVAKLKAWLAAAPTPAPAPTQAPKK